jgi:hypothetical protein
MLRVGAGDAVGRGVWEMVVGEGLPDTCGGCDPSGAGASFSEGATQPVMIKKAIRIMIIRGFRTIYVGSDNRIKINLP